MRNKKRMMALLLIALMLAGCTPTEGPSMPEETPNDIAPQEAASAQSVTYVGEASGFAGPVVAYVTLQGDTITDVVLQGNNETPGKGSLALEQMPELIIAANSTEVDSIASATVTSNAVIAAVNAALTNKQVSEAPSMTAAVEYKAGTYSAKAFGFNSMISVETTFSSDAITKVEVVDNSSETPYLRDLCAQTIPAAIVDHQSLSVDVVTGATWGSTAIINAVTDCAQQAGGDNAVQVLKSTNVAKPTGEDVTYEGYDLAVVGGGGSGLIAASVAVEAGLKVVIIEAADRWGGVSEIAGGGTLAIGTDMQLEAGVYEDAGVSVEQTFNELTQAFMDSCRYQANPLIIKRFLQATADAADFMASLGMPYTVRGTTALNYGDKGMRFEPIATQLEGRGAKLLLSTRANKLLLSSDGSVSGVEATNQKNGATVTVKASAVLLATGGSSNNNALMAQHAPDYNEQYMNWGGSTANGDGVRMAWEVGAAQTLMGTQSHNEGLPLEFHDMFDFDITTGNCLYANLVYEPMLRLNRHTGRRISDETIMYTPHYQGNMSMVSEGAIVIIDQATIDSLMENGSQTRPWRSRLYQEPMKQPDYTGMNLQQQLDMVIDANTVYARKADTLEALAQAIGIETAILENEIAKYNAAVETGVDEEFGRAADTLVYSVSEGPYYALDTKIRNLGTWGGIETDETLAVYDTKGSVIPGLYASGLDALGWVGTSYFVDTTTLGWMTASGYMAGQSVVEFIQTK